MNSRLLVLLLKIPAPALLNELQLITRLRPLISIPSEAVFVGAVFFPFELVRQSITLEEPPAMMPLPWLLCAVQFCSVVKFPVLKPSPSFSDELESRIVQPLPAIMPSPVIPVTVLWETIE